MKFKIKKIETIKKEEYNGKVYDFEVKTNHSYTVGSNNTIVHNSACSTRLVAGHGIPQLSAIMNIRKALNGMQSNIPLIADGGIKNSGDIAKAIAAGADCVMIGRLFAGTEEAPKIFNEEGNLTYRGQSSKHFMNDIQKNGVAAEGVHFCIHENGPVANIFDELIGGLRSAMSYSGVFNLRDLTNKSVFMEISNHAFVEGTPHGH